jgi:hypothetical protein
MFYFYFAEMPTSFQKIVVIMQKERAGMRILMAALAGNRIEAA